MNIKMNGYCMNINVLGINQISLLKWRFSQSVFVELQSNEDFKSFMN